MSAYDDFQYLKVGVDDGIATVTLDGGDAANTLTFEGHAEMCRIFGRLDNDEAVRAVVFTGAGDSFCAGAKPEMMSRMAGGDQAYIARVMSDVRELVHNGIAFEKPVVTALNGPAVGGALVFALLADIVVAERHVSLSDMHIVTAVTPGDGNVLLWPLAMGLMRAKRYLMLGEAMSAEEAYGFGLVTEVVDRGLSLTRALQYARRLADMSSTAMRHTKRSLNQWLRAALPAYEISWAGEMLTVNDTRAHERWAALVRGEIDVVSRK